MHTFKTLARAHVFHAQLGTSVDTSSVCINVQFCSGKPKLYADCHICSSNLLSNDDQILLPCCLSSLSIWSVFKKLGYRRLCKLTTLVNFYHINILCIAHGSWIIRSREPAFVYGFAFLKNGKPTPRLTLNASACMHKLLSPSSGHTFSFCLRWLIRKRHRMAEWVVRYVWFHFSSVSWKSIQGAWKLVKIYVYCFDYGNSVVFLNHKLLFMQL